MLNDTETLNEPTGTILECRRAFDLTTEEKEFMNSFYYAILNGKRKKFEKKYVIQIHRYLAEDLGIKQMPRAEKRTISRYFHYFYPEKDRIIKYLFEKREFLLSQIPDLRNYITNIS